MNRLIIQGSSRSDGNTNKVIEVLRKEAEFDLLDLNTKRIGPFDYEFNNQDDDFLPIIKAIAEYYDVIVFATPVYWYSMSGIMKNFFDRISDCLKIEKETGRKLRGKSMAMISCGSDRDQVPGFEVPFKMSAEYLGMNYLGNIHTWLEDDIIPDSLITELKAFTQTLK
jgi:multimeric flavodoxin WrbA